MKMHEIVTGLNSTVHYGLLRLNSSVSPLVALCYLMSSTEKSPNGV